MIVTSLNLDNLRAIEAAEFTFKPGFNLIVGVNGVGKSTVLDALRICMSRILPSITESRAQAMSFGIDDIRVGFPFLEAELTFDLGGQEFHFTRRQWREQVAVDDSENIERLRREILDSTRLRDRPRNLIRALEESQDLVDSDTFDRPKSDLRRAGQALEVSPNCVFFATNRSVASYTAASKGRAAGKTAAAYAEALNPRSWQVSQFADWMRVQGALATESQLAGRHLDILKEAASRFLPGYDNLRPNDENRSRLLINRDGITLDVAQLSDGERGVLAMVLDLARRLSQANPNLDDPLQQGQAIVLIDEIDLHLHPKWQRSIVENLTRVFPHCQFIATTHSPQVIGEIAHDRIQIISDGHVYSPSHSFGIDSSRVLEEIMDARARTKEVEILLKRFSQEIGKEHYEAARTSLTELEGTLGEDDPEVIRARTLLDFLGDEG